VILETINGNLDFWAARWPDRTALWCNGQTLSWGALQRRASELAAGFAEAGVRPGEPIGILMRNRLEFCEVLLAAFKIGAAAVPLNVRYTSRELAHPVRDSGMRLMIADEAFLPILAEARNALPHPTVYTTDPVAGERDLAELRRAGETPPHVEVSGSDTAMICYTSGTTGVPKGAVITHGGLYSASVSKSFALGQSFDDRVLVSMPLAYTGGCILTLRDGLIPGATTYISSASDALELLEIVEQERITCLAGVAVLFERMSAHPSFKSRNLSSLRHAVTGGSVVTTHLLRSWQAQGVQLTQGYGLTESSGSFVTCLFGDEAERKLGTAGRPLPHVQVKIVDDAGQERPTGEVGEIWVGGPIVMKGYLNSPELTRETIRDGWLRTGDIGRFDADGYLSIVDRSKDMLISGGLNVYPAELERTLGGWNGLREFAIIGLRDSRWGEVPVLVVEGDNPIDVEGLSAFCVENLADYKRPRHLVYHREPLPRTFSGKIAKPELRKAYSELPADAVLIKR
jgi:fatty-acyl-CoA synthase